MLKKAFLINIFLIIFSLASDNLFAGPHISTRTRPEMYDDILMYYDHSGLFVIIPSTCGAVPFSLVGVAIGTTVGLVLTPFTLEPSDGWWTYRIPSYFICPLLGGVHGFYIGKCVVGAPFYISKYIVWDLPLRAINKHLLDTSQNETEALNDPQH